MSVRPLYKQKVSPGYICMWQTSLLCRQTCADRKWHTLIQPAACKAYPVAGGKQCICLYLHSCVSPEQIMQNLVSVQKSVQIILLFWYWMADSRERLSPEQGFLVTFVHSSNNSSRSLIILALIHLQTSGNTCWFLCFASISVKVAVLSRATITRTYFVEYGDKNNCGNYWY